MLVDEINNQAQKISKVQKILLEVKTSSKKPNQDWVITQKFLNWQSIVQLFLILN